MEELLRIVDHTLLKQDARWRDIRKICDEAMEYHTASVCIPPGYVKEAVDYGQGRFVICTVIGFPNGYQTTDTKVFETHDAIENGADEIDMVVNIGWIKDGRYDEIKQEIEAIKRACGTRVLKVIIETCLLEEEEKIFMCNVVTDAGADYIKTSTGFAGGGATFVDVSLFRQHVGGNVKIKAAGGINSLKDAREFVNRGACRLGTSKIIKLIKQEQTEGY